jgi:hypothetical protein
MNKVNELSPEMKKKYLDKAKDSKDSHQRIAKDYKTRTGSADSPKNDWTDHMASVHQRKADSRAKGIKRADEKVTSADKKPEMYTDEKGKRRVRMVKTDKEIIKQEEGYIGGKGEKGRDKGNAGKFDKNTAYSHAKTHNGVVHKDTSGSYLVKHGRGKNVSEEPVAEVWRKTPTPIGGKGSSAKYKEAEAEYDREKSFARIKQQRKSHQTNVKTEKSDPCWDDHEMVGTKKKNGKTVPNCVPKESVVSELTDKEREKIARIRDKKAPARDADGRSSVKRQQKKKDAAANPKKAAAPKPVKSKPKTTYDDKADLHPIIQLRKVVDTKGVHTPVFHKGKTGKVSADDAHHVLKMYDKLPVMGKRQLKIRLAKGGPAAVKQAAAAHRSLGK